MSTSSSAQIKRDLSQKCAALGIPLNGIFELTPRCNLRCKMCYVRLTPAQMAPLGRELTADQWLDLAQQAKDMGMAFLLITGGEPTLRDDFIQIYTGLAGMGISLTVNTNATLLTPAIRELWHQLPPAQVNVTVYGTCREDYAALCGDAEAFDRMVDAIHWLQSENILVHLNTTMSPDNADKWYKIESFAKDHGLALRMTAYCFPPIRRAECGNCDDYSRLSPEKAAELIINDIYFREGPAMIKRRAADLSHPIRSDCDLGVGEAMRCLAGRSQFWIAWNGRMTPCGMLREPATYPIDNSFSDAWKLLRNETAAIRLCPDCAHCEERGTCLNCAAVIYAETGSFTERPEYMCQLNHAYRQQITRSAEGSDDTIRSNNEAFPPNR